VGDLVKLHHIVVLQETHGTEHDLNTIRHMHPQHYIRGSFTDSGRGGGLVFIIDPNLATAYNVHDSEQVTVHHIIPGRVAKVKFPGTDKLMAMEVTNIHFEVELQAGDQGFYGARFALADAILGSIAPRHLVHTIFAGDWNSTASDDPRLNPIEGTFSAGRSSISKHLEAGLEDFTELFQPHYTRRGISGGVIVNLSRIDRIYSNCSTCELLDRRPVVATFGLITDTTSPSDHIPVTAKFFPPPSGPPQHPSIPPWVAKHRFFALAVAQLWRTARYVSVGPLARLTIAKEVIHAAAIIAKKKAAEVGAESVPEKLHWALMAFRGLRAGEAGRFHLRQAAAAFPDLIPGSLGASTPTTSTSSVTWWPTSRPSP
jgi:hypothetical protein